MDATNYRLDVRLPIKGKTQEEAIAIADKLLANLHLTGQPAVTDGNDAILFSTVISDVVIQSWNLEELNHVTSS